MDEKKEHIQDEPDDGMEQIVLNEQSPKAKQHKGMTVQKLFQRIGHILNKFKVLIILIVLALIGFFVYRNYQTKQQLAQAMASSAQTETATIEKRDLTTSITTTGTVEAQESRTVTSAIKDIKITSVNAEVGDTVQAGDILVTFSDEDINRTIADLKDDISVSQQKEAIQAETQNREYIYTYGTQANNISSAVQSVDNALTSLHEACNAYGSAKTARDTAKTALDAAQAALDAANSSASANEITKAQTAYNTAKTAYDNAESKVTSAYNTQVSAQQTYDNAVQNQATTTSSAANSLSSADENYQTNSLTQGDSTKTLERQLESYQESLSDYVVTAPISGIVTASNVENGNGFTGGDIMTIQNTDSYTISTEIDEYDIPDIELGQKVVIKTDATRDDELEGTVSFISPTATTGSSSGVTFSVKIDVLTMDDRLKIGMSAKLNIIVDEVTDVLTVPYDAVTENAAGDSVIYVVDTPAMAQPADVENITDAANTNDTVGTGGTAGAAGALSGDTAGNTSTDNTSTDNASAESTSGQRSGKNAGQGMPAMNQKEVVVTVGAESDYYTQVTSDEISEGMTVVIQSASTNGSGTGQNQSSSMFSIGGGGGQGGGGAPGGGPGGGF